MILLEQEHLKYAGPRIAILNAQPGMKQVIEIFYKRKKLTLFLNFLKVLGCGVNINNILNMFFRLDLKTNQDEKDVTQRAMSATTLASSWITTLRTQSRMPSCHKTIMTMT